MSEVFRKNPENEKTVADNARKFIVVGDDPRTHANGDVASFRLTTNWLKTDESTETKVVYKEYATGEGQALLIAKKTTQDGRIAEKSTITTDEYEDLLSRSILEIEKQRHEFNVEISDMLFEMKFDVFADSSLRMLEVDGSNRDDFDPGLFMGGSLTEVSSDKSYEGYRIADKLRVSD